ncbi:MAG TPA: FAD:protein FMN transferase [Amycolatopsis sp.]|uniref:FAD:protein FMN transferase n=1 Tax=Amycolatopsis nalaikhensis TaxID=715472 RepID=A0ABY8XE12_9PSEU|nr:FAD:protein FMN transferase [Amycolatopsis sp. 2-2]WIV53857.1 FAD:protein FMN transferase [Amycolatopsis sp. 2-2]HWD02726.1 FAD:protein FMN transferase [Amycolatopsis sp.]
MGTQVSLHLRGPRVDIDPAVEPAVAAVFGHLRAADELFSTYRPDSQVSAIRRGELPHDQWHPWVTEVVALCEEARERTDGYFDPWRLPGGFDPSGLVKGWAAETAAAHLARLRGFDHYLNTGGDITAATRTRPWRVGVEDPADPAAFLAVLELRTGGLATSGMAARGPHIVDPHTGIHPCGLHAVTVSGPTLRWADVFATAAFARGGEDVEEWVPARAPGYEIAALARAP